jgi:hypothetical protein
MRMDCEPSPRVVYADRVGGGVAIEFDDGECALYTADLLDSMRRQAIKLDSTFDDDSESH